METIPNHVRNILTFKNFHTGEKDFIVERLTSWREDLGDRILDFDKIIPEPQKKEDCPEDCLVNKDSHVSKDEDRPWFDWYAWHNKYWGTKWDAYDGGTWIHPEEVECYFNTAWSAPYPIYEQLAKLYPNFEWEVRYADESITENSGVIRHYKGTDTIYEEPVDHEKIYNEVWGYDEED